MELTPELYNAIKASLSEHEKIEFGYPGIDGSMRCYESLDDVPLDLSGGDTVVLVVRCHYPTTCFISKKMWAEFTIDASKFIKEKSDGNKKG